MTKRYGEAEGESWRAMTEALGVPVATLIDACRMSKGQLPNIAAHFPVAPYLSREPVTLDYSWVIASSSADEFR